MEFNLEWRKISYELLWALTMDWPWSVPVHLMVMNGMDDLSETPAQQPLAAAVWQGAEKAAAASHV